MKNIKKILTAALACATVLTSGTTASMAAGATEEKKTDLIVTLDPGHGYNSTEKCFSGAAGAIKWGGKQEDYYNWDMAQACKDRLEEYGVTVYLTMDSRHDTPSYDDRVMTAVKNGSSALISIHNNSSTNTAARGTQIFIVNPNYNEQMYLNSAKMANAVMKRLNNDVGTNKNCNPYYSNLDPGENPHPDGSVAEYYAMLWRPKRWSEGKYRGSKLSAAMIVEGCFQSNEADVKEFLLDQSKVEAMGVAIADGIADFYELKHPSDTEAVTEAVTEPVTDTAAVTEPVSEGKNNSTLKSVLIGLAIGLPVAAAVVAVPLYIDKKKKSNGAK